MKSNEFLMDRLPELPVLQRTLFLTYGTLVFEDHFDLALKFVESCRKTSPPTADSNTPNADQEKGLDDAANLAFEQLRRLCEEHGVDRLSKIGELVKKIQKRSKNPSSPTRVAILSAHTILTLKLDRLPTIEELRRAVWESKERKAIGVSTMSAAQVAAALQKAWKEQSGKTPIRRKDDFSDEVKQMGLQTTDGKLLRRCQSTFKILSKTLARAPTEEEFIDAIIKTKGELGGRLHAAKFDDLVCLLREPVTNDRLYAWTGTGKILEGLKEASKIQKIPESQANAMSALVSAIWKLGFVLEQIGGFILTEEGGSFPRPSESLVSIVKRLASERKMLPDFSAVYFTMTDSEFKHEASHAGLSKEETMALAELRTAYAQQKEHLGRDPLIGELASIHEPVHLMVRLIEPVWIRFWPSTLFIGLTMVH